MERQRPGTISPGMGPQSRLPSFPALPRPSGEHLYADADTSTQSHAHTSRILSILFLSFVNFNLSASSTFKNSFTLGKLLSFDSMSACACTSMTVICLLTSNMELIGRVE